MELNFLGGIFESDHHLGVRGNQPWGEQTSAGDWVGSGAGGQLFLRRRGGFGTLFTSDSVAVLLRGYARPAGSSGPLDLERIAEGLCWHYREKDELDIDGLEGSFTVVLLDAQVGRVLLYRNLVGTGFTYYHPAPGGFLFGSNLADLVDAAGNRPQPNEAALPTFFLYRCVPGPETLFDGFRRLLPGEEVIWERGRWMCRQRHTFPDLAGDPVPDREALEQLEDVMARVVRDCAAHRPDTANLLSGGIDSSYLQGVWNRVAAERAVASRRPEADELPRSFSLSVDHPRSWPDTEYAVTAAEALGTRHTLTPVDGPYAGYLLETLAATAEPPNHVQSAYFGHLARAMVEHGHASGLCGEGADSLFGLGLANRLHNAAWLRAALPLPPVRGGVALLANLLGWSRLREVCHMAGRLTDLTDLEHPVNQVAAFTDWDAVRDCFGADAVARAAADRRALLDRFAVPNNPQDLLHAAGFLGEAIDSAGLWTTLFQREGADLLCPFLDSRVVRLALNLSPRVRYRFRRPKDLLKRALARYVPAPLVRRGKLGFGQPIFEWLAPGGQLRPLAERIGPHPFLDRGVRARSLARPNWFLSTLLCYDLWHRLYIERSLPRDARPGTLLAELPAVASSR